MVVQSFYSRDPRVRRDAEALVRAGHTVQVICLAEKQDYTDLEGVEVFYVPVPRSRRGIGNYLIEYMSFFVRSLWLVCILFWKYRHDVVQVHNMPDFLVFSAFVPRLCGRPVILDIHDPMPELFMEKFSLGYKHWFIRLIRFQEMISCKFASRVMTVNDPCKTVLVSRGVPPEKCTVILNVPDHNLFARGSRPKYVADTPFNLIYTGTIAKRHGLDVAVRSMAALRHKIPSMKLTIVGDGDYLNDLMALAAQAQVSDVVEFLPPVPLREVPKLLAQAHVGISVQQRGVFSDLCLSTKVLEYLRAGLPVVCARTPTVTHYFDGEILSLFEAGDVTSFAEAVLGVYEVYGRDWSEHLAVIEELVTRLSWQHEQQKYIGEIVSSNVA